MPCSCSAAETLDIFGEKAARRALRRYLDHGLGGADAMQIAAWAEEGGLDGAEVIEVGGGVGQIQAELLRRGAAKGRVVEVVAEYESVAAELARAADVGDRSSFQPFAPRSSDKSAADETRRPRPPRWKWHCADARSGRQISTCAQALGGGETGRTRQSSRPLGTRVGRRG